MRGERPNWSDLMARAQDGDREAYRDLLQSIAPVLRALAHRGLVHPSDVEDVVQDILLTIHAVRHTYDPRRPFGPWLYAVARRRIADRLRQTQQRRTHETEFGPHHETFADPGANVQERGADAAALQKAIENLPPRQRDAVLLLRLREMPLKEAAATSGISVAALKVAVHRALKSLRAMLAKED